MLGNQQSPGRSHASSYYGTPKPGSPETYQAGLHARALHRGGLTGQPPQVEGIDNHDWKPQLTLIWCPNLGIG
jgi:hypothetical protein